VKSKTNFSLPFPQLLCHLGEHRHKNPHVILLIICQISCGCKLPSRMYRQTVRHSESQHGRQCTYDVTLRRVRATIVTVEKQ